MLIFTLLISILLGQSEIDPSTFYCKTNYELKILKLSNDDLIFYGSEGGILRTTDGGDSWVQNYSGTHDNILKLIEHKNIVYGITQTGNFMYSDDNGDYWKYINIGSILTDFTILNDVIYVTSNTDTIFVSSDFGMSWESKTQNQTTNTKGISNLNDKLILLGNNQANKLFILNQDLTLDMELSTPFNIGVITDKYEDIYIKDGTKLAKLNQDFTWQTYNLFNDLTDFKFYPEENEISIFVYNPKERYNPKIDYFQYDVSSQTMNNLNSYSNNQMNVYSIFYTEFQTVDIEKINNNFILSNHHKTILKIDSENNWHLLSNAASNPAYNFIYNYNNIVYNSGFGIVTSEDYGTTYQFKPIPIVNSSGDSVRVGVDYVEFIYDKKALILLKSSGLKNDNLVKSIPFRLAYSKDNFNSIKNLKYSFSAPFLTPYQTTDCLGLIEDKPIINRTYKMVTTVPDSNNSLNDSLYFNCLYNFNIETETIDSVNTIIDSLQFPKLYAENEKLWIYGTNSTSFKNAIIYLSEDKGKTFNRVVDINLSPDGANYPHQSSTPSLRRSKDGNLYLLSELLIAKINENDYSYEKIQNENFKLFVGQINTYSGYLEDCIYILTIPNNDKEDVVFVKLEIDGNKVNLNKLFTRNNLMNLVYSSNNDYMMLTQGVQGKYYRLFFPIEPERLEYYTSSVERGGPPAIWTYPPYPNPVKDILKMKFYSAMMNQIANLKVELIEIGSGRIYRVEDYKISKTSDYWGEIIIDIGNYQTGAYLINFKLGEGNKSESIIIE